MTFEKSHLFLLDSHHLEHNPSSLHISYLKYSNIHALFVNQLNAGSVNRFLQSELVWKCLQLVGIIGKHYDAKIPRG